MNLEELAKFAKGQLFMPRLTLDAQARRQYHDRMRRFSLMRAGQPVSRLSHKQEILGSIPRPASNTRNSDAPAARELPGRLFPHRNHGKEGNG